MVFKEIHTVVKFISNVELWRMGVLWMVSLIYSYLLILSQRMWPDNCTTFIRQGVAPVFASQRPVCVVTGATSGLGAAAAHALSREGFFVILVGRSGNLLSKTMAEIRKMNEIAQLEAFEVDLSSFSSIMKLKDSIQQWLIDMNLHSSVQLLVNNAGIFATSQRTTFDGFDEMMMTNYMGTFTLTKLLLPLLIDSPVPARIVNVSSFTHRNVYDIQVDEGSVCGKSFSNFKEYPFARIYGYSKFCMLIFSYELHRQISNMEKASQLSVNVADPGLVKTNLLREIPPCLCRPAFWFLKLLRLLQYPEEGVNSILDASLAPPGTSGMYFFGGNSRTITSSSMSYNARLAEKLWGISCDLWLELKHSYEKTAVYVSNC